MPRTDDRKRRGQEILKKYRPMCGNDSYAAASDAIADILMAVAESEEEARQINHAAEIDFRSTIEGEELISEG